MNEKLIQTIDAAFSSIESASQKAGEKILAAFKAARKTQFSKEDAKELSTHWKEAGIAPATRRQRLARLRAMLEEHGIRVERDSRGGARKPKSKTSEAKEAQEAQEAQKLPIDDFLAQVPEIVLQWAIENPALAVKALQREMDKQLLKAA